MLMLPSEINSRIDGEIALCAAIFDRAGKDFRKAWKDAEISEPNGELIKLYRFYHSENASVLSFGKAEIAYEKLVEKMQTKRKLPASVYLPKDALEKFSLTY